jgi:nitroimidazol reductase NimA-like FMN-containing flavoprotein (pyridoxamine 5'-phosphate oxidase superfamily)
MFPKMRRIKSIMSKEDTIKLLNRCDEGVLGTIGTNGYPHTVPLNYVLFNNKIYFHSAKEGFKLRNIEDNPKVSFTVYDNVVIIQEKRTTYYQSAIVYGKAKIIPGNKEVLMELIKKYSSDFLVEGKKDVYDNYDTAYLIEITIDHISGKESKI